MNGPLSDVSSEILVWIFWNMPDDFIGADELFAEIHAEMNARGEGAKVAV